MQICKDLNMDQTSLYKWIAIYDDFGEIGFLPKKRKKSYTADFKETGVNEYIEGKGSYDDIARKYEIPSSAILKRWVSKYNGYEKLKDYNPSGIRQRETRKKILSNQRTT